MFKIPREAVIKLNNVSKKPLKGLLFIVAGIEGNCEVFRDLAASLEYSDIQIFGLEYTDKVPTDTIGSVARFYSNLIQQKLAELNERRFSLAAYSFGGIRLL